ncbi:MAG: hypothetical protein HWD60_00230 [Defluviicoccus sp.]|nr:MAG: hypothetical protein HWD60_00230 [Defluviicoccus sp.]
MSRIVTAAELEHRTLEYLQQLYRQVQQELTRSAPGSDQRRNALASLETISRAIARLRACQPRPPGF